LESEGRQSREPSRAPALEALADVMVGDDLAAMLSGMRTGESAELQCEDGRFEIVRDR
jgi:hypothetical protein